MYLPFRFVVVICLFLLCPLIQASADSGKPKTGSEAYKSPPEKSGLLFKKPEGFVLKNRSKTPNGGSILEFTRAGDSLEGNREIVSVSTIAKLVKGLRLEPFFEAQQNAFKKDKCRVDVVDGLPKMDLSVLFTYHCKRKPGSAPRTGHMRVFDGDLATYYVLLWEFDSEIESLQRNSEALAWLKQQKSCSSEKPTDCI